MWEKTTSREYTADEVIEKFLLHIANLINYWSDEQRRITSQERLEGLAHSILVTLDGYSANLPGFVVAPAPHPSDRAYCMDKRENYYSAAPQATCDIAGHLHEVLYSYSRRSAQRF
jgi:hypothetical protein